MASHLSQQDAVQRTIPRQLYDIGFDVPETHVIRKGNTMYYAFFAKQWKGRKSTCEDLKTATTVSSIMSPEKPWGRFQDTMRVCQ